MFLVDYQDNKLPQYRTAINGSSLKWQGQSYSMSDLARELLQKEGYSSSSVRGPAHWCTEDGVSVKNLWQQHLNSMEKIIYFFTKNDHYYEFSNFSSHGLEVESHYWPTVEHYFQAQKFINTEQYEKIKKSYSPKQAKELGQSRKVAIRSDWDSVKEGVMLFALREKFSNPKLKALLMKTGKNKLVKNSPYDRYWGCGKDGCGKNRLGMLLMQVRDEFKYEK